MPSSVVSLRRVRALRRLWPLCLIVTAWGCDDVPRQAPAEVSVARLLEEFTPFEFDFDLTDVSGNRLAKEDFAGKVLIVDVWGTWCPPCRMELPHLIALNREFHDQGLAVIGLNDEGDRATRSVDERTVRQFCEANGVDYPCAVITRQIKRQIPGYGSFPTTMFLDRSGTVRLKVAGLLDRAFLQEVVETLLKEPAPGGTAAEPDQNESADDAGTKSAGE